MMKIIENIRKWFKKEKTFELSLEVRLKRLLHYNLTSWLGEEFMFENAWTARGRSLVNILCKILPEVLTDSKYLHNLSEIQIPIIAKYYIDNKTSWNISESERITTNDMVTSRECIIKREKII